MTFLWRQLGNRKDSTAKWQILKDCPGTYNLHDSVRVLGRDHKKHDENLDKVIRKFEEHGLSLEYMGWLSLEYMGEVLTGEGLQISRRREEATVDAPKPQNQSKVGSFPGSALLGISTISSRLWDLTCIGKSRKWVTKEE